MIILKKDINIQIGQRVRHARENARLSRDELAEKLNISSLFLSYIECGQKGMSLTTLQNICQILGVSADYLLLGVDDADIHKKNINLMLDSLNEEFLPVIEFQIKSLIYSTMEIYRLSSKKRDPASAEHASKCPC